MSNKSNINAINVNTRNFNYHTLNRDGVRGGMEWVTMPQRKWGFNGSNTPVGSFGGGFNIKGSNFGTLYVEERVGDNPDGSGNFLVFVDNSGMGHTIAGGGGIGYWTTVIPGSGVSIGSGGYIRPMKDISAIIAYDHNISPSNTITAQNNFWKTLQYVDSSNQPVHLDDAALIVMDKMQFLEASGNSAGDGGLGTIRYTYLKPNTTDLDPSGSSFQGLVYGPNHSHHWVKFGEGQHTAITYWRNEKLVSAGTNDYKVTTTGITPPTITLELQGADASANYSVAIGLNSKTRPDASGSVAIGIGNTTSAPGAVALGYDCSAGGIASFADGSGCTARGAYSVALGYGADTSNNYQFVLGISNNVAASGMATGGGNTFFIDNSQNVAMCVGGDLSFDVSRCRADVPVLDISGDLRVRGNCNINLRLIVQDLSAIRIFTRDLSATNLDISGVLGISGCSIYAADGSGIVMDCSLSLNCHNLLDVSSITFCDGTYIGHGNSFDISTNQLLRITAQGVTIGAANNTASQLYSVALGYDCSANKSYSVALGKNADTSNNYQFVLGISNESMAGNTFFIDNSQNVAMCVGGDPGFDISRCRSHLNVPVLDVSGDVRIRGICDPLGLGLVNAATVADASAIYLSMDGSANAQMLFTSNEHRDQIWHMYTDSTVISARVGGGSGTGHWAVLKPTPPQGLVLTPDATDDASGIMLKQTLIYGTDASGLMVGDGNDISGNTAIAMGRDNKININNYSNILTPVGGTAAGAVALGFGNKIAYAQPSGGYNNNNVGYADGAVALGYGNQIVAAIGIPVVGAMGQANYAFAEGSGNQIACVAHQLIQQPPHAVGAVAMGEGNIIGGGGVVAGPNEARYTKANYAVALGYRNSIVGSSTAGTNLEHAYYTFAEGSGNRIESRDGEYTDGAVAMGEGNRVTAHHAVAIGQDCSASNPYSLALGYKADTSNNYQFVVGISNNVAASGMATGGGNTFFIDNSQNVAMCVGGDLGFDASRCRAGIPVLDVSGDVRIRGICDPLGLGLINVSQVDAIAIFNSMDGSRNAQLLFSNSDATNELWHCFTVLPNATTTAKIGGGSSTGYWSQGSNFLTPDIANYGIKLDETLIYGTDSSGLTVGDGNTASGEYSVAMGKDCSAGNPYSVALGYNADTSSNYQFVLGISNNVAASGMATGGGNTFFIDNSQNVAMCVGGDLGFDASRCRAGIPVLDVSGDVRIRGICDPLGLGLINVSQVDAIAIFNSMDGSRNAQLLFSNSDATNELWHCFTVLPNATTTAKIGGGSSTGYWSQGSNFLTPDIANYGIKLDETLIYGTDSSGLTVGDGNTASGEYSVAMGYSNNALSPYSVAMGWKAGSPEPSSRRRMAFGLEGLTFTDGTTFFIDIDQNVAIGVGGNPNHVAVVPTTGRPVLDISGDLRVRGNIYGPGNLASSSTTSAAKSGSMIIDASGYEAGLFPWMSGNLTPGTGGASVLTSTVTISLATVTGIQKQPKAFRLTLIGGGGGGAGGDPNTYGPPPAARCGGGGGGGAASTRASAIAPELFVLYGQTKPYPNAWHYAGGGALLEIGRGGGGGDGGIVADHVQPTIGYGGGNTSWLGLLANGGGGGQRANTSNGDAPGSGGGAAQDYLWQQTPYIGGGYIAASWATPAGLNWGPAPNPPPHPPNTVGHFGWGGVSYTGLASNGNGVHYVGSQSEYPGPGGARGSSFNALGVVEVGQVNYGPLLPSYGGTYKSLDGGSVDYGSGYPGSGAADGADGGGYGGGGAGAWGMAFDTNGDATNNGGNGGNGSFGAIMIEWWN